MSKFGETAVIIGGSLAGLMTAQVLAGRFSNVRIIERDEIDPGPKLHKSIPQGNHYHALLAGGQRVMKGLFPDFAERLTAAGAVPEGELAKTAPPNVSVPPVPSKTVS